MQSLPILTLRTNEEIEAVRALEMVAKLLPTVEHDAYQWKWVLIALHNAVQGFMVLSLQGTWPVRVFMEAHAKKAIEAYEQEVAKPRDERDYERMFLSGKLDYFLNLYEKIQSDEQMGQFVTSRTFRPDGTQTQSMEQLNEKRNGFMHFVPISTTMYVGDFPTVLGDCVALMSFLAFDSQNVTWGIQDQLEEQTRTLLDQVRTQASRLASMYSSSEA